MRIIYYLRLNCAKKCVYLKASSRVCMITTEDVLFKILCSKVGFLFVQSKNILIIFGVLFDVYIRGY